MYNRPVRKYKTFNEGLRLPRFDSQLAATSLLGVRIVEDTPSWSKVRRRTTSDGNDRNASREREVLRRQNR